MPMKRCEKGHYFDANKHTNCPACGVPDLDLGMTRAGSIPAPVQNATVRYSPGEQLPPRQEAAWRSPQESEDTVVVGQSRSTVEMVVGWLVCSEGGDRGRDFRLHSEKNYIGRSEKMDICLRGDQAVSRENHAIVSYNPKNGVFKVHPGEGRGMVYLNGDDVDTPRELTPYAVIELGETKLVFVPFCGDKFQWVTGFNFNV